MLALMVEAIPVVLRWELVAMGRDGEEAGRDCGEFEVVLALMLCCFLR